MKNNIVLIGMMGAGKTTTGIAVSKKLSGYTFIDIDSEIEQSKNMLISEIFEKYGEAYFRTLESEYIKKIANLSQLIISTGGGVVERSENLDILRKNGVVFYLSAPIGELFERVKLSTHRPLLNLADPKDKIRELLCRRERYYKMADYEINTSGKDISQIVEEIIDKYEK